ncbi:MAG: MFS transporter [Erysipelotrichaceae bacterium]|nr:MFS transporter [Erysipelotrichaceae bacterium]
MKKPLMSNSIFEKSFMNSRISTEEMTMKEKILGYIIGPLGMLSLQAVINQLAELYYTEIFYIDQIFGVGTYLVMSWVTKIVSMFAGLLVAYIVEHSNSSQGKIRPFVLIGQVLCAVSGFLMFAIPEIGHVGMLIWVYVFNILYNGFGITMFLLRKNMITLATRNQDDRNQINLFDRVTAFMLVGVAVTMVVGSILYYTMLHGYPKENWLMVIGLIALVSIPLSLINYFYTKERVTLEAEDVEGALYNQENGTDWKRFLDLFKCKYWNMAFILTTLNLIVGNLQGYNLNTNFCTVILGANAENNYNLFYTIASGLPMGIGILLVYPLSKKFTIRKTTMAFALFCIIGCIMGLIVKGNFLGAVIAFFINNIGTLPVVYVLDSLLLSANDEVEYKFGFRPEGTVALAVTTAIATIISGAFAGVYETGLSYFGYQADLGMNQPRGVISWLYFIRYIIAIIQYVIIFVVLYFMNLEEKLPEMQKEIQARKESVSE